MALDLNGMLGINVDTSKVKKAIDDLNNLKQASKDVIDEFEKLNNLKPALTKGGASTAGEGKVRKPRESSTTKPVVDSAEISKADAAIAKLQETLFLVAGGYSLAAAKAVAAIRTMKDATTDQKALMEGLLNDAGNLAAARAEYNKSLKAQLADLNRYNKEVERLQGQALSEDEKRTNAKLKAEQRKQDKLARLQVQAIMEDRKRAEEKKAQAQKELDDLSRIHTQAIIEDRKKAREKVEAAQKEIDDLAKLQGQAIEEDKRRSKVTVNTSGSRNTGGVNSSSIDREIQALRLQQSEYKRLGDAKLAATVTSLKLRGATDAQILAYARESKALDELLAKKTIYERLQQNLGRVAQNALAFAFGFSIYNTLRTAFTGFIEGAKNLDQIEVSLRTAMGSASLARVEFDRLVNTATNLSLPIYEVAKGFAQFTISARGSALTTDELRTAYDNLLIASAGSGVGMDEFNGIIKAITQVMSKGKVQAEELRGQLGDRLPGAVAIAARSMGKSMKEFDESMKKGEISARDFVTNFTRGMSEVYAAVAELRGGTVTGALENLRNAFREVMIDLRDAGATDAFAASINGTADAVRSVTSAVKTASGFFDEFLVILGGAAAGLLFAKLSTLGFVGALFAMDVALTKSIPIVVAFGRVLLAAIPYAAIITGVSLLAVGLYKLAEQYGIIGDKASKFGKETNLAKNADADFRTSVELTNAAMEEFKGRDLASFSASNLEQFSEAFQKHYDITLLNIQSTGDLIGKRMLENESLSKSSDAYKENEKLIGESRKKLDEYIVSLQTIIPLIGQAKQASTGNALNGLADDLKKDLALLDKELAAAKAGPEQLKAFRTEQKALNDLRSSRKEAKDLTDDQIKGDQVLSGLLSEKVRKQTDLAALERTSKKSESELTREQRFLTQKIANLAQIEKFLGQNLSLEKARAAAELMAKGGASETVAKAYAEKLVSTELRASFIAEKEKADIESARVNITKGLVDVTNDLNLATEVANYLAQGAANYNEALALALQNRANAMDRSLASAKQELDIAKQRAGLIAKSSGVVDQERLAIESTPDSQMSPAEKEVRLQVLAQTRLNNQEIEKKNNAFLIEQMVKLGDVELARILAQTQGNLEQAKSIRNAQIMTDLAAELQTMKFNPFFELSQLNLGNVFGNMGSQIDNMVSSMGDLVESTIQYNREQKAAAGNSELLGVSQKKFDRARLNALGSILGGTKNLFKENSKGYKALEKAEKALLIVRIVSSAQAAAAQVGAALTSGLAYAKTAVAAAAALPPPFGFASAAAMIALMASIGFSVGGGGGTYTPPVAGTGTVLGRPEAQDESLSNALEKLQDIQGENLRVSYAMLSALRSIEIGLIGVTGQLFAENRGSGGATPFGNFSGSSSSPFEFNSVGRTTANILIPGFNKIDKLTGGIVGTIIDIQDKIFGSIGKFIFGSKKKQIDEGIILGTGQDLGEVLAGGLEGVYFQTIKTTKKAFGIKIKSRTKDETTPLENSLLAQFEDIIGSVANAAAAGLRFLSVDQATIDSAFAGIDIGAILGKISFKDKTDEDITKELNAAFSGLGSTIVETVLPGIIEFQRAGEGAFETLARVTAETSAMQGIFDFLGLTIRGTGLELVRVSEGIANLFGGFDNATQSLLSYTDLVLSESEKTAAYTRQLDDLTSTLGIGSIRTSNDLRSIIDPILGIAAVDPNALTPAQEQTLAALSQLTELTSLVAENTRNAVEELMSFRERVLGINESPEAAYQRTRADFLDVQARAASGDITAINMLDEVGAAFLEASSNYNASSAAFFSDQALVLQSIDRSLAILGAPTNPLMGPVGTVGSAQSNDQTVAILQQQLEEANALTETLIAVQAESNAQIIELMKRTEVRAEDTNTAVRLETARPRTGGRSSPYVVNNF